MRVCFLPLPLRVASARLRGLIPAQYMRAQGVEVAADYTKPSDVVILSKHLTDEKFRQHARRVIFDICDDHFSGEHEQAVREGCRVADVITCNSRAMADTIRRETGRDAVVIDDPYESPECAPKCHAPVLWFGHRSNLPTLLPWVDRLPEMVVVTDAPGFTPWSPETMEAAWDQCGLVVLPTGDKQAKSANRAVESIRRGLFPVCGRMPAYEELGLGVDDVATSVDRCLSNPKATVDRVAALQDVVRERFSPETVGRKWLEVCTGTS